MKPIINALTLFLCLRQLSWAASAHLNKHLNAPLSQQGAHGGGVAVHACHSGVGGVSQRSSLRRRGDSGDSAVASEGSGAAGSVVRSPSEAAVVPVFLSTNSRLDALGPGPFFWGPGLKLDDCE